MSVNGFAAQTEWEHPETHEWEGAHEGEWEHPEAHEWETAHEWESTGEWEHPEAHEWEAAHEWEGGHESDPFLPLLPLAAMAAKAAMPLARRLLPVAGRAIGSVVRNILADGGPAQPPAQVSRVRRRRAPRRNAVAGSNRQLALNLLKRLRGIVARGEAEAEHAEAALFTQSEGEWEVSGHPAAAEAALTEVLAAEAAHTASEAEAEALLGAALPITIRIMGGRRSMRTVTPALVRANAGLVRGLRRNAPPLLRTVPTIQRRTVASLRAIQRSGRPVRPAMVAPVMAAQAARVLGTPRICGPAIVRNTSIRRCTVAQHSRRASN